MAQGNGYYQESLQRIEKNTEDIKDNLAIAIKELGSEIRGLAIEIKEARQAAKEVIPVKAVFWMWIIMLIGLIGIEGLKHLPKILGLLGAP